MQTLTGDVQTRFANPERERRARARSRVKQRNRARRSRSGFANKCTWLTFFFVVVVASIAFYLWLALSAHVWKQWRGARISISGQPSSDSTAYRSKTGDILLALPHPDSSSLLYYVVKPKSAEVGFPPSQGLLTPFPGHLYSYQAPLITIPLDGSEGKMDRFDAKVNLKPQRAEFTTLKKQRVAVEW